MGCPLRNCASVVCMLNRTKSPHESSLVKHSVSSVNRPQVPYFWPSSSDFVLSAGVLNAKLHHRYNAKQLEE